MDRPNSDLTIDAKGNLSGANFTGGRNNDGNVFKLNWPNVGWVYTDIYEFTAGTTASAKRWSGDRQQRKHIRHHDPRRQQRLWHRVGD
jgi:hypothetical protein